MNSGRIYQIIGLGLFILAMILIGTAHYHCFFRTKKYFKIALIAEYNTLEMKLFIFSIILIILGFIFFGIS